MQNTYLKKVLKKLNHHRTTEVYFIAYPKTGNTWTRIMLGRYVQLVCEMPSLPLFDATDSFGRCERGCIGPAMQFTHRPLTWQTQTAADLNFDNVIRPFVNKKVVLIVRHPLDALVSFWLQQKFRVAGGFESGINEFLADPIFGLDKCLRFHEIWLEGQEQVDGFHLLRYEDLRKNAGTAFRQLLAFLGIPIEDDFVQKATEFATFENMKKLEESDNSLTYKSSKLSIFATGDKNNPEAFHVRKGKVGGFRDYIEPAAVAEYEQTIASRVGQWLDYGNLDLRKTGNVC